MAEVVDAERHLEAVVSEAGLGVGRQVDGLRAPAGRSVRPGGQRLGGGAMARAHRVAHEPIETALPERALQVSRKVLD